MTCESCSVPLSGRNERTCYNCPSSTEVENWVFEQQMKEYMLQYDTSETTNTGETENEKTT